MARNRLYLHLGLVLVPMILAATVASAASSISNSLTGFTGDSTLPATQTAVAGAGFNFSSTDGFTENPPTVFSDPTIQFDATGANYGTGFGGDGGRNYIRTKDADYANVSFVAELTFVAPDIDNQDVYFGLGAGDRVPTAFYTPDWTTPNSSVMFWGESEIADPTVTVFRNTNGSGPSTDTPAPGLGDGTHRVRLTYDWFEKTATFSFDLNYAGGPFTADVTAPPMNVIDNYGATGWPTEPARIFFGGDDGIVLKDFQVTVTSPPIIFGDFNSDGTVTAADWAILRANQNADLTGKSASQAYFLGDLTQDKANNYADFVAFKALYEAANGAGSFAAMVSGVPEPSTLVLIILAGGMAKFLGRRGVRRT